MKPPRIDPSMPSVDYHADLVGDRPSLSASIAAVLINQSPLHAWTRHPKLNPNFESDDDKKYDLGTVAHAMLLQVQDVAVQVDADSWRTNAAKEQRDAAYAAGQVPLLTKDWDRCQAMVAAAWDQLAWIPEKLLDEGKPEQTLVWEEPNGVLCRSRLDWLRDDYTAIDDLKTTARSANPESFTRTLFNIGADTQVVFYRRGVERITGIVPEFRFIALETQPPYALSVVSLAPSALALAERKVDYAIETWARCLETGEWPGYPRQVAYAEAPSYLESQWFDKEDREAA